MRGEATPVGTEDKIILAALKQFEQNGFAAATTKAIAEEAGVAEVTLFRYFGDKKTLFLKTALLIGEKLGLIDLMQTASGSLREDIHCVCTELLRHFIRMNGVIRMLLFESKKNKATFGLMLEVRRKAIENIKTLVGRYPQGEGCTQDSLEWLMSSLIGASLSYHMFHENDSQKAFVSAQAGLIADAFLNQISTVGK